MTDRELMQQALSVLCNNVYPRDGARDNRHLAPKSHAAIYQQTIDVLHDRLAQPEQEPVAWYDKHGMVTHDPFEGIRPLYAAPRQWVGLTDEEVHDCFQQGHKNKAIERQLISKAIEAKLKEKNT
jgi:hypothetical protein